MILFTILKHLFHLSTIVGFGYVAIFLYPEWLQGGYLEDWYPRIGAAIAVYGGFIGSLVWYILNFMYI